MTTGLGCRDSQYWQAACDATVGGDQRERLGEWWLRADQGQTGRANSTWPTGAPPTSLAAAIDEVEAWYHQRSLTPMFQLFQTTDRALGAELDRRGWRYGDGADVLAVALDDARSRAQAVPSVEIAIAAEPSVGFQNLTNNPARVAEMCRSDEQRFFVTASDDAGKTIGCGLGIRAGDAVGIFAMRTAEQLRRQGVARNVLETLLDAARDVGVEVAFLQVMESNTAAQALYADVGFELVERYVYRAAPTLGP